MIAAADPRERLDGQEAAMRRKAYYRLVVALLGASAAACAQPLDPEAGVGLTSRCIEGIADLALSNPRTNEIAANYAGPVGLTPTSDPGAAPYRTKQAEFRFPDGTGHYFAVDNARWTKALLIRVAPTAGEPRMRWFIMDRDGHLLAAALIEERKLSILDKGSPAVRADFFTEQALWRLAGADEACGPS